MSAPEYYRFTKRGFKRRQSDKLKDPNKRGSILISCDLNNDAKVGLLFKQKDFTLLPLYLEILFNLDLETEVWEISTVALMDWCKKRFDSNNRFDLRQRLSFLQAAGLIDMEILSNDQTLGKHSPNIDQTLGKVSPNIDQTSDNVTHLEGGKSGSTTDPLYNQPTNQHKQANTSARAVFLEKAEKAFLKAGNPNMNQSGWIEGYLTDQLDEIRNSRPEIPAEAILKIWQECCDDASVKGVRAVKWYRTAFENRVADWQPKATKGSKPKPENPFLKAHREGRRFFHEGLMKTFRAEELEPINYNLKRVEGKLDGFRLPDGDRFYFEEFTIGD